MNFTNSELVFPLYFTYDDIKIKADQQLIYLSVVIMGNDIRSTDTKQNMISIVVINYLSRNHHR